MGEAVKEKVILSWSGGKDCALALHELGKSNGYEVAALLTTITRDYDRICVHGVRTILLEQQAESLGLPLEKIFISKNASNEEYESRMREILEKYQAEGVGAVVFGDIFLEDLRQYRQERLAQIAMKGLFPIFTSLILIQVMILFCLIRCFIFTKKIRKERKNS